MPAPADCGDPFFKRLQRIGEQRIAFEHDLLRLV